MLGKTLLIDATRQLDLLDTNVAEVRAAGAEISSLYVCDSSRVTGWPDDVLAAALHDRYKVPVHGSTPVFTEADWEKRSAKATTKAFDFAYADLRNPTGTP